MRSVKEVLGELGASYKVSAFPENVLVPAFVMLVIFGVVKAWWPDLLPGW